jgi:formylglycine-generating enzyme required for sulfatase activity
MREWCGLPPARFRIGSERHYPEEAPVRAVSVGPFWIDPVPVTNGAFREFAEATGYATMAEKVPDARDYPGALPHMLKPGSLVFTPPRQGPSRRRSCASFSRRSPRRPRPLPVPAH